MAGQSETHGPSPALEVRSLHHGRVKSNTYSSLGVKWTTDATNLPPSADKSKRTTVLGHLFEIEIVAMT